jgi:hypothetical protein
MPLRSVRKRYNRGWQSEELKHGVVVLLVGSTVWVGAPHHVP